VISGMGLYCIIVCAMHIAAYHKKDEIGDWYLCLFWAMVASLLLIGSK
jgi:hypothetical protein